MPAHLLEEGKGRKAASSRDTVPVRSQTAADCKAEITATYGDFALRTVLQNLTKVFDPKQKNRRARDTSPMDQIAELVLDKELDRTTVEAMLESAVEEENAFRSDQSLSSRGRTEEKRRRPKRREKISSSSDEKGTKSKYQGKNRGDYHDRSRSRQEEKTKRIAMFEQDPSSSDTGSSYPDFKADVPICGACGREVELDDGLNDFGKTWLQARDGTYIHASCWAAHPEGWEGHIDQTPIDALAYEPGDPICEACQRPVPHVAS